jgi:hypothetical protein
MDSRHAGDRRRQPRMPGLDPDPACRRHPDPLSGSRGAHPLGTGLGAGSGAAIGFAAGAAFGPIGMLIGGVGGALAGAAAGHAAAESLEPTCEREYWSTEHPRRDYARSEFDFDRDYFPAYRYGAEARRRFGARRWEDRVEGELAAQWPQARGRSRLDWSAARPAVREAWERASRTYTAYADADTYFATRWGDAEYHDLGYDFEDFRNAYRYGVYVRRSHPARQWDARLERALEPGWDTARGASRLDWERARHAAREAWLRDSERSARH